MKFTKKKKNLSKSPHLLVVVFLSSVAGSFMLFKSAHSRLMMSSSFLEEAVQSALRGERGVVDAVSVQSNAAVSSSLGQLHILPNNKVLSSDQLWTIIVNHATDIVGSDNNVGVAMEVGMHSAKQCLEAAKAGLNAHCFEPSPTSFDRVKTQVQQEPKDVQDRVSIYNQAASGTSEGTIEFKSSGGTGDHVGEFDMWRMKKTTADNDLKGTIVQVPQIRLDDVVNKLDSDVFVLKVDTQGFEPIVLSGLSESLKQHKIKFLLMEYWPRGMDLHAGKPDACVAADVLSNLVEAGYTLYALTVTAHPKAPPGYKKVVNERPLNDLRENCQWYLDLEKRFPSDDYFMGYWSDILAVAPDASPYQERLFSNL